MNSMRKTYVSIDNKEHQFEYNIGDSVYLKTYNDQLERIVTAVLIRESGVMFALSQSNTSSYHYSFEIARDRNVLKVSTS